MRREREAIITVVVTGRALLDDGLEQQKFPEETGHRRDARQRHHGQRQGRGQQRRALIQTRKSRNVLAVQMPHHDADDQKRRHHREQITRQIIQQRRLPGHAQGRHAQQQIARVGDARITEQPFQIALRQRAEVAVKNRDAGNDDQQIRPVPRHIRQGGEQHAQQQDKSGGLGTDGEKRRGRRGRALINVRHPDLEWKSRDFEADANQHE